jgi:hypothetical protein
VAQLKANPHYRSEAERVRAFIAKGAGSRSKTAWYLIIADAVMQQMPRDGFRVSPY